MEEITKDVDQATTDETNIEKVKNKHLDVIQYEVRRSRSPSIEVELQRLVKDVSDNVSDISKNNYKHYFLFTQFKFKH